jgi:hypothetical protein
MKCFVALDEETLLRLWLQSPDLVVPFVRPFCPSSSLHYSTKALHALPDSAHLKPFFNSSARSA